MIGVLFATEMEAAAFQSRDIPDDVMLKVADEMGLEAARIAAEELVECGATTIINAGVCAALHNRLERGSVYRISTVITEELKAAVKGSCKCGCWTRTQEISECGGAFVSSGSQTGISPSV